MPRSTTYLFVELAILVYVTGYGWHYWNLANLRSRAFLQAALGLGFVWFTLDQIAIRLGMWKFPAGGTLHYRLFSLPIEEYVLFFLHTFICFVFVKQCWKREE